MDDASNQGRMIDDLDKDDVVTLMDDKEDDKKEEEAKVVEDDQVQGRQAESQAKIYKINMDHASKVLSDKKKVVVTESAIREVLRLDDAKGVDCVPNEEIFVELARMGYEKPSTKLTFYKAFFSSQWKFLIHTILQSMSTKHTSWNEFSSAMASAVICLSTSRNFNFSKYIFDSLKIFANTRRIRKGFSGVETPLFEGMLLGQVIEEGGDAEEHVQDVTDEALDACAALTRRVEHLEYDKVAQALEITKLKRRVKKLKNGNKGRIIDEMDKDDVVALMDDKEEDKKDEEAKEDEPAEVQEVVDVVTTAKLIIEVVTVASEIVTAGSTTIFAIEPQVPAATITAALVRVAA
nr:hypothetical protein [Tanacetum cinerariifolium]